MSNELEMEWARVLWRDGDLVTARHFRALESWAEGLIAVGLATTGRHGLFRGPRENDVNTDESIRIVQYESGRDVLHVELEVERLRAVTPTGRVLVIDEPVRRMLEIRRGPKGDATGLPLFVSALASCDAAGPDETPPDANGHVGGVPVLYAPGCELTTSNEDGRGLLVGRLDVSGEEPRIDRAVIPRTFHVRGSRACLTRTEMLVSALEQPIDALEVEFLRGPPGSSDRHPAAARSLARQVLSSWCGRYLRLTDPEVDPKELFFELFGFLASIRVDLQLLDGSDGSFEGVRALEQELRAWDAPGRRTEDLAPLFDAAELAIRDVGKGLDEILRITSPTPSSIAIESIEPEDYSDVFERITIRLREPLGAELGRRSAESVEIRLPRGERVHRQLIPMHEDEEKPPAHIGFRCQPRSDLDDSLVLHFVPTPEQMASRMIVLNPWKHTVDLKNAKQRVRLFGAKGE